MEYTVAKLTTIADCDAVLAIIAAEKASILYKKGLLVHRQSLIGKSSQEIVAELGNLAIQIAGYESMVQNLPEGPQKADASMDLEKASYRKKVLLSRMGEQGPVALLGIEIELGQLEAQEAELQIAEAAVIARKAAL